MKLMKIGDLDAVIASLNKNKIIANITQDKLNDLELTQVEKELIITYTPERSLIVYGTLAPGKPNHFVVEHIKGKWKKGIIRGNLENIIWGAELGYLAFKHCQPEEQQTIPAFILVSYELVKNWPMLDDFEGEEYQRILAK